eukprot:TRINITY_DN2627_c0_g1_i2.p1 TRINITY_DN2627_c0_g1~~TRINITY_DN2627_c0_g1_i2.p1  ORF type:complete len:277 (+),score=47.04 TRINITY_DN2627_c0_g1_i2:186-1016(+)
MASQYALSTAPAPCVSCHAKNETFFSRSNRCSYFLSACKRKCTSHTKTTFSYSKLTCKKTWRIYAVSEGSLIAQPSKAVMISLEGAKIIDLNGNEVQVVDLWKDRKVVIGFARHFGCVLCRKRADLLASQKRDDHFGAIAKEAFRIGRLLLVAQSQMDLAGVTLALVGPGSLDQAKAFVDQTKFPGEVYADPHHSAYDALKFVSGISSTFTPSVCFLPILFQLSIPLPRTNYSFHSVDCMPFGITTIKFKRQLERFSNCIVKDTDRTGAFLSKRTQ